MRYSVRILAAAVFVLLLAACGGSSEPEAPETVEYTIEMTEFTYTPDVLNLKVGQVVTLNLVNHGQLEHELMIGRDMMTENSLPAGYEVDFFENAGVEPAVMMAEQMDDQEHMEGEDADHMDDENMDDENMDDEHMDDEHMDDEHMDTAEHAHHGFMVAVPKEDTATMTFTVTEEMVGTWEMGCFLQDGAHYFAEMKGTIEVEG